MSLEKTQYNNSFIKSNKFNFFKKRIIADNPLQKLVPTFSISNYTTKNQKSPIFLRTSNLYFSNASFNNNNTNKSNYMQLKYKTKPKLIQIRKIKIKKSLSEIFQNNDIDLVRNLNLDSLTQFNNNIRLKENLINLSRDYFQKSEKKIKNIIFGNTNEKDISNNDKDNREINDDFE